jgi:transcription elongation factor GreA
MKKQFHLTESGLKDLRAEYAALVANRSEVAERIKTAREFGDLSENAEYSSARQDQEKAESRISEIENIIENYEIIKQPKAKGVVSLGNTVTLEGSNGKKELTIVGSVEANPLEGRISNESPIGKALLGKNIDETVEIITPAETASYRIVSIN